MLLDGKNSLRGLECYTYLNTRLSALKCSTVGSSMKRDKTFLIYMVSGLVFLARYELTRLLNSCESNLTESS